MNTPTPGAPLNHAAERAVFRASLRRHQDNKARHRQDGKAKARRVAPRTLWSLSLQERIPALYAKQSLTTNEIADMLGLTPTTVNSYLPNGVQERHLHDVTVLRSRGLVPAAIADRLLLSDRTVAHYLKQTDPHHPAPRTTPGASSTEPK